MMTSKLKLLAARKASGFSLLELLLVVAVAAVLILAGVAAYSLVSGNQKASDAKRQIAQIKATIKNNFPNGNYTTATLANLGNMGAFTGMKGTAAAPQDPWGSAVTVTGTTANVTINFPGVPRANCVDIAMSTGTDSDLILIQGAGPAQTIANGAITQAQAIATCTGAGLSWRFR